ncbi:hypothetical protein DSO57_1021539 [Entomophthora muscae]|uniref:Uncharacterized protein n=1 Tax=Entomophthora muscae TaxID=34485 RepID=A0ACC2SG56_9FUNG|nr:hypothetical protein DSO57_1021539 [Entomophthora muscae]
MGLGLNPVPDSLQPASLEDQELRYLQPNDSKNVSEVNANFLGSEFFPETLFLQANCQCLAIEVFPNLGSEIRNPANEKSPESSPVLSDTCHMNLSYTNATNDKLSSPDARLFSKIPTHDKNCSGGKKSKSTNENCPEPAQSLENDTVPEYLLNANYQVVKQKGSKVYSSEITNGNLPIPDSTLPPLEFQHLPV